MLKMRMNIFTVGFIFGHILGDYIIDLFGINHADFSILLLTLLFLGGFYEKYRKRGRGVVQNVGQPDSGEKAGAKNENADPGAPGS